MKQPQHITPVGTKTTFIEVWRWGQELEPLHERIAPRFARPEPRRGTLAFLKGIVSSIERKNGWQLAEHTGESRPDGMQRLLSSAVWDADQVRDDLRAYILERLGDPGAVVVIDETSCRKSGKKSAGAGMQHCGTTGKARELPGRRLSGLRQFQGLHVAGSRTLSAEALDGGSAVVPGSWHP